MLNRVNRRVNAINPAALVLNLGKPVCDISLNIKNNALPEVPTCRDLGVNVTSDLAASVHIDHILSLIHI